MGDSGLRSHRGISLAIVLAFAVDAAALALYLLDEIKAGDYLRGLLTVGDPDLPIFTSPFNGASQAAVLLLASGLVLAGLLLWRVRRILFALMGLWSVLVVGATLWTLNPTVAHLRFWQVRPLGVATDALNVVLIAASGLCLAASLAGWVLMPAGPDWLAIPIARRAIWPPPPPPTHQN